ncbi:MAG: phage major capsid protein, partial [bacterium]|nr:phage major capsid protein [bacterium]
ENMIRDQMVKAMRLKMENGALFGSGGVPDDDTATGAEPLGVRYTPGVAITALSPARLPEMNDLKTAQASLEDADVEEAESWGWMSHPRTFRHFEYMRDENGRPILRDSWANGVRERTLVDFDYHRTTTIPKNLGTGSNESTLFFGDWENLVVGMGMDVELVVSEHVDIKNNATFVMAVAYVDTVVGYPEAFHIHTGVLG